MANADAGERRIKENLINLMHSRRIEFEDKAIAVPGNPATRLWYAHFYPWDSSSKIVIEKTTGDWVNCGDVILSQDGVRLRSPITGFLISHPSPDPPTFWETIPQKNFDIPDNVIELVFGELIDLAQTYESSRLSNQEVSEIIRELRNSKMIEKDINDEMRLLIESVKGKR